MVRVREEVLLGGLATVLTQRLFHQAVWWGGLTLAGQQEPIKLLYHSPSQQGRQGGNKMGKNNLWVKIKAV